MLTFTFLLCYVVLSVAASDKTKSTEMFGLCIGACVTVGGVAIGAVSGGSLNPAVTVGLVSTRLSATVMWNGFIYICAEFVAGVLAAIVFQVTHAVDTDKTDDSVA